MKQKQNRNNYEKEEEAEAETEESIARKSLSKLATLLSVTAVLWVVESELSWVELS